MWGVEKKPKHMKTTGRDGRAADVRVHGPMGRSSAPGQSKLHGTGRRVLTPRRDLLGLLAPHLPEGRPLFLLLQVRVVAGVLGVVAGVAVRVKDVGRAQLVDRGQRDARRVPEAHGAVLVSVQAQRGKILLSLKWIRWRRAGLMDFGIYYIATDEKNRCVDVCKC